MICFFFDREKHNTDSRVSMNVIHGEWDKQSDIKRPCSGLAIKTSVILSIKSSLTVLTLFQ